MAILYKTQNIFIRTKECDLNDYLRPASVLDYFQDIAGVHATELGLGYDNMLKNNLFWVILYEQFEVIKEIPKYSDEVEICTWPKQSSKLQMEREYVIKNHSGEILIKGISNWAVIDSRTRRLARADKIIFNGEYYPYTNYQDKQVHKLGLKCDNFRHTYEYKINLSDLDHNKHLNNARYLDIVYNMGIINHKKYKRVQIAFLHEAYLNDVIRVGHFVDINNNDCFYRLCQW
ncbi:MAG: acyl-[acyl-carrier-protein] thioesterase [Anaeroplasma sp.]